MVDDKTKYAIKSHFDDGMGFGNICEKFKIGYSEVVYICFEDTEFVKICQEIGMPKNQIKVLITKLRQIGIDFCNLDEFIQIDFDTLLSPIPWKGFTEAYVDKCKMIVRKYNGENVSVAKYKENKEIQRNYETIKSLRIQLDEEREENRKLRTAYKELKKEMKIILREKEKIMRIRKMLLETTNSFLEKEQNDGQRTY